MTNKLDDETLEKVTGGDNGDSRNEGAFYKDEVRYLYDINDEVEVYDTGWHTTTEHATIIDRRPRYVCDIGRYGCNRYIGEYQVHYRDKVSGYHYQDDWVTADEIESS